MKNLNSILNKCKEELNNIGVECGNVVSIMPDNRAQKRYGLCSKRNGNYSIKIASKLLGDDVPDAPAKNTVMHELIHTCANCMTHKNEWKRIAERVNKVYGYNVTRTAYYPEIEEKHPTQYKYEITCKNCGAKLRRSRTSNLIQNINNYRCGRCHGQLEVKDL